MKSDEPDLDRIKKMSEQELLDFVATQRPIHVTRADDPLTPEDMCQGYMAILRVAEAFERGGRPAAEKQADRELSRRSGKTK